MPIVRIDTTTICGTDLHILKGDVPAVTDGRILGHEGVGTVLEVGASVTQRRGRRPRDHLVHQRRAACAPTAAAATRRTAWPTRAPPGSAGSSVTSSTARRPRWCAIPFADNSLYKLPDGVPDEAAMLLSDIFPTGFEMGIEYGQVKPGDTVAVVGAGPVGLAAIATAGLLRRGPGHRDRPRRRTGLAVAKQIGATHSVNSGAADWKEQVLALTDGYGVDVAVEAVGIADDLRHVHPARAPRWQRRQRRRARQGGAAGPAGPLDQEHHHQHGAGEHDEAWRCCSSWSRRASCRSTKFVTHRFELDDVVFAYETFGNAAQTQAIKVLLSR